MKKYNKILDDEMFDDIRKLDEKFYGKEYLWDKNYQKIIYNENKKSFIIAVDDNGKVIGYLNYLNINAQKFDYIKKTKEIVDFFNFKAIKRFSKKLDTYIIIDSIVIDKKWQNTEIISSITNSFIKELVKLYNNGYKIKGITGTSVSKDGYKFLKRLGLKEFKKLEDENYLFILENDDFEKFIEEKRKIYEK